MRARFLGAAVALALLLLVRVFLSLSGETSSNSRAAAPVDNFEIDSAVERPQLPLLFHVDGEASIPVVSRVATDANSAEELADFLASLPDAPAKIDTRDLARQADALFHRLDRNGDGLLNEDELPPNLRDERGKWDVNQDGVIDRAEFLAYYKVRFAQSQPETGALRPRAVSRPTSGRTGAAGREGGNLPAWFHEMDLDNDGQIAMYEWLASGQPIEAFRAMDRNEDGILTPNEVRYAVARQPLLAVSPSPINTGQGKGSQRWSQAAVFSSAMTGAFTLNQPPSGKSSSPAPASPTGMVQARAAPSPPPLPPPPWPPPPPYPPASSDSWATMALPINDGSNKIWTQRSNAYDNWLKKGGRAKVVFLGDSITDWLATGVGEPLWDENFAPLGAIDLAVQGFTTSHVLWQVETGRVALAGPQVIVLMIGTNNLGWGQSTAATAAGITKIVRELQGQLPRTRILLLGILPRNRPQDQIRSDISQVNATIAPLGETRNVTFLDFGERYLLPTDQAMNLDAMPDYTHPSLLGYEYYTDAIWRPLIELLGL
jgi:lysophospholipase L1-like esterase/Ca2+-binding EF-hand superfamily protein